jgi:hypothetical protein
MTLKAVLHETSVAADCAQKLALYGWLVGDWQSDVTTHGLDGKSHHGKGEIRAGWILGGTAIRFRGTGTARPFEPLT